MTALPTVALVAHGVHDQGGMERACAELIRRGQGRVHFVVVSAELAEELRPRVEWRRIRVPMRPVPLKSLLFFVLAGLRLRRVRADLVHSVGAIVPNRVDVTAVHFCHVGFFRATGRLAVPGMPALRRANTAVDRLLALVAERWCYRPGRTKLLAAVSGGVASELLRYYPGIPVALTPNGVDLPCQQWDPQARERLRAEGGAAPDDVVALFVGGFWDWKGLAIAIGALAHAPVRLWVVGAGDERRFSRLARRLGVGDRVNFLGRQASVAPWLNSADVFVLPSLYETFSIAAYEAAACGLPVVATPVHGVRELVGDGAAGRLVERTPGAVGAALAELAGDPALRGRLGAEARRRAATYDWQSAVHEVLGLYERLLEQSPRELVAA